MQSKEAESILPLMLGVNKLILVGDYHQLRSNVLSKVSVFKKLTVKNLNKLLQK